MNGVRAFIAATVMGLAAAGAGEGGLGAITETGAQRFSQTSIPEFSKAFTSEDGTFVQARLVREIHADTARNSMDPVTHEQRVNFTNPRVLVYDDNPKTLRETAADDKLPLKLKITARNGEYHTRLNPQTRQYEKILVLSDDVVVRQYAAPDADGRAPDGEKEPPVFTTITCQYAQWNHTLKTMSGHTGLRFEQGGSVLEGAEFLYTGADQTQFDPAKPIEDWDGNFEISGRVMMRIDPQRIEGGAQTGPVTITCEDRANFYPRDQFVEFIKSVEVRSPDFTIQTGDDTASKVMLLLPSATQANYHLTAVNRVVVTGALPGLAAAPDRAGERFQAASDRLDLDLGTDGARRLDLTMLPVERISGGPRQYSLPLARLEKDSIQDRHITFFFAAAAEGEHAGRDRLASVRASGGDGEVVIDRGPYPALVQYRGTLDYLLEQGVASFTRVRHVWIGDRAAPRFKMEGADDARGDDIDTLHVHLTRLAALMDPAAAVGEPAAASDDVTGRFVDPRAILEAFAAARITLAMGEWRAKANRLSYNPRLDLLVLQSRGREGQWQLPACEVLHDGSQLEFTSPQIHISRHPADPAAPAKTDLERPFILNAGPGENYCRFIVPGDDHAENDARDGLGMNISSDYLMMFDQATLRATFEGLVRADGGLGVRAESLNPGDFYTLEGHQLEIKLMPVPPPPDKPGRQTYDARLIDVQGHAPTARPAVFRWQHNAERWQCTGMRVTYGHEHSRDPTLGAYVHVMNRMRNDDPVSPLRATIQQERGILFEADTISMGRFGTWGVARVEPGARAHGRLVIPTEAQPVSIQFARSANYREITPVQKMITFTDGVKLDWPVENIHMEGWYLQAEIVVVDSPAPDAANGDGARLGDRLLATHRLQSACVKNRNPEDPPDGPDRRVRVTYAGEATADAPRTVRAAQADEAWLFPAEGQAHMMLRADPRRLVELDDTGLGVRVAAPFIQTWQAPPRFEATRGAGYLVLRDVAPASGAAPRAPLRVDYDRSLTVDQTAGRVDMVGNVRLAATDESLLLAGDRMTLTMTQSGEIGRADDPYFAQIQRIEATQSAEQGSMGAVILESHPPATASAPTLRKLDRPGRAMWVRAGRAVMDMTRRQFEIGGRTARGGHRPQIQIQEREPTPAGFTPKPPIRYGFFLPDPLTLPVLDGKPEFPRGGVGLDSITVPDGAPMAFDNNQ